MHGRGNQTNGRIEVTETLFRGHRARLLFVDGALQSAVALEEGKRQTLLFPYLRGFDWAMRIRPGIRSALLIGGGGFVYADHFLHAYPKTSLDVVEMSAEIIAIARRDFFLNAVEADYGERFALYETDGLSYLLGCPRRYDLILNDAFLGKTADADLLAPDGLALIRSRLVAGGLYVCNVPAAPRGPLSLPARRAKRRAAVQFRNTALMQADDTRNKFEPQNCLLLASDREL